MAYKYVYNIYEIIMWARSVGAIVLLINTKTVDKCEKCDTIEA